MVNRERSAYCSCMRCQVVVAVIAATSPAVAQRWEDATATCLGDTAEWSNKVEVADLDEDGRLDILIANGGNYSSAGSPERVRIWNNLGDWTAAPPRCTEVSEQVVDGFMGLSRAIKAVDVDRDGDLDIITGGAYQTQLKLFVSSQGDWIDATAQLPQQLTSIGDLEGGDVDGDGDLDLLLAEWGATAPNAPGYPGGRTRLYVNDGIGTFTDATATQMPDVLVKWSWELELVDVDNDWDLDALIACKACSRSYLFRNDGEGHFTDDPNALPAFANNYDFEAMDIDGDDDLDLVTINDGLDLREHILINDGAGTFSDETSARLTGAANPADADDNAAVWFDVDDDGDSDLLIASLGDDRLLLNDGGGHFTLDPGAVPADTPSTLGIAIGDLNGDGRIDLVQAQGESAFPDKLQLANDAVAVDSHPPRIAGAFECELSPGLELPCRFDVRVFDLQAPARADDMTRVWIEALHQPGPIHELSWSGSFVWSTTFWHEASGGPWDYRACAIDRTGNQACIEPFRLPSTADGDGSPQDPEAPPTGGCRATGEPGSSAVLIGVAVIGWLRRRRNFATLTLP
ncbi:MAG: FG-GAP repeat domain-containing protein [Kofleriaceae bacterium]